MSMSVYELKRKYQEKNPEGHFFDKETLKYWGDRLSDFTVLAKPVKVRDYRGNMCACYVLRRKHPKGNTWQEAYFDTVTLRQIHGEVAV